jgi:hypothetical protein
MLYLERLASVISFIGGATAITASSTSDRGTPLFASAVSHTVICHLAQLGTLGTLREDFFACAAAEQSSNEFKNLAVVLECPPAAAIACIAAAVVTPLLACGRRPALFLAQV